jgi:hypothetical protein
MVRAGFVEVAVHPTLLVTTDAERFRFLSPRSFEARLNDLVATGDLARERADAFVTDQAERIATGRFLVATPLYFVTGTKPAETGPRRPSSRHLPPGTESVDPSLATS